jgi:hypothetical protein
VERGRRDKKSDRRDKERDRRDKVYSIRCTILCYTVSYRNVPCCIVLYCIVLH